MSQWPRAVTAFLLWVCATAAALAQTTVTSTEADQKQLSVTVYNSNIALVSDVRRVNLPTGAIDLRYMDIAAQVNPATVHIVSRTAPKELNVLEQNYEYDLLSPQKLLQKYVGKELTLIRVEMENNSTREVPVKALLLADNEGPVWRVGNEIITGMGTDRYEFPDVPADLYSKPTLIWLLENHHSGEQTVEASYLTNQVNWTADYVLTLAAGEKSGDLNGWVSVDNRSGTAFRNAQLQLVAGELNRVAPPVSGRRLEMAARATPMAEAQFAQEPISEYHLYTLQRPTTIANNETKQISLLNASDVQTAKEYEVNGQAFYFQTVQTPGQPMKEPVRVLIKFKNSQQDALGVPLPAGTVRVYEADSKGRMQFIGEDHIDHTPEDETVSLHIGNAFDVVAERKQTDFQRLSPHLWEVENEITIRNHKPDSITVEVNEPLMGDWTILNSSFPYEKTAASAARFTVPVPANGEAVLKYRVRIHS